MPIVSPQPSAAPVPSGDRLIKLYSEMFRIRLCEEHIAERYSEQEMRCPVHLCIGQEAIPVGVSANLTRNDYVLSGHRSHGHYLAKGGNLRRMMAELYGKATGCAQGKGGSMHLIDLSAGFLGATPIVASAIPIAVGVAFGTVMRGEDHVTVVYFGEGATEEGVFHESLNFAVLKHLPIVFVCENNLYSVYSPLSVRQPKERSIVGLAEAHGCPGFHADGNDVNHMYRFAHDAIHKARTGGGPTLLEAQTYRWREHCGPSFDNDLGYRSVEEFEEWRKICPIHSLQTQLCEQGIWNERLQADLTKSLTAEFEDAVSFAKGSPFPEPEQIAQHLYAENLAASKEQAA